MTSGAGGLFWHTIDLLSFFFLQSARALDTVAVAMQRAPKHVLTPYPRGWYLAAYSDQLRVGEVKPLRLFGQDVVLFRDEPGQAHLVDAHCPHLGAHLGHGGKVVGDCIRCPFHGWEYQGSTGQCLRTGNGDPVPPRARLASWPIAEVAGMILVWFHERKEAPSWDVGELPDHAESGWSRWAYKEYRLRSTIQDISENDADVSHSPVMHGFTDRPPAIQMDASGARCHWLMHTDLKLEAFGVPKLPTVGPLRLIPSRLPSEISVTRWGLSLGWIRQTLQLPGGLRFRTQTLATTTPLDETHVLLTFRHRVRNAPARPLTEVTLRNYSRLFNSTVEQDITIWENKVYVTRPVASKSDWAVLRFRKWARQFYDSEAFDAVFEHSPH
jgi:phenylpropionate dioxygenase-like ring-hydroxylating dioxygenase large terminal subunit